MENEDRNGDMGDRWRGARVQSPRPMPILTRTPPHYFPVYAARASQLRPSHTLQEDNVVFSSVSS